MERTSSVTQLFASRLRALMLAKGYRSDRSRSGVDVGALAKAVRVSYEMARRYAEGVAMPRPDVLRAIAVWLDVDPAALAYGHGTGGVDPVLLEQCLAAVQEAQQLAKVRLSSDQAARIVSELYQDGGGQSAKSLAVVLKAIINR